MPAIIHDFKAIGAKLRKRRVDDWWQPELGIEVSQATVGRYLPWRPKDPSPTWRSFLHNHLADTVAIDMFIVATATFRVLYTLIALDHDRRKIIHFGVTENPTQVWLSQWIANAFPWDTAPRFLLRDRDASYGPAFRGRIKSMGVEEVVTAPRSSWQNPFVERLIGSIRRECLDHVIIFNERHFRRVLSSYVQYHHEARTHLSLNKDLPSAAPRAASLCGQDCRVSTSWRAAPPLRTSRRLSYVGDRSGDPPWPRAAVRFFTHASFRCQLLSRRTHCGWTMLRLAILDRQS